MVSTHIITGSANGHPDIGERAIIDSLSDTLVYGLIAAGDTGDTGLNYRDELRSWPITGIIGLRQSGNTLTVSLYSLRNNGRMADYSSPRSGVTLTKR